MDKFLHDHLSSAGSEPAENGVSCQDCDQLRALFASLEPGPAPEELRSQVAVALEAETAPQVARTARKSLFALAGLAAAVWVGMVLAPSLSWRSEPMSPQLLPVPQVSAAAEDVLPLEIRKESGTVVLSWENGHGEYVVEKASRPNAWEDAEQVSVRGHAWSDATLVAGNSLTFYRVRPVSGNAPGSAN